MLQLSNSLKALFKEPLLHFSIGALLIFVVAHIAEQPEQIVIDQSDINRLAASWRQNFYREPTESELDGLIHAAVTEEIYFREALKLGLDQGDPVVRRRMVTKLQFLNEKSPSEYTPAKQVLENWLMAHSQRYRLDDEFELEQVYLGEVESVDTDDVTRILTQLNEENLNPRTLGKISTLLPDEIRGTRATIGVEFGASFADALADLGPGQWSGPVTSGFGFHLVKLNAFRPGRQPTLDEVYQSVLNDWRASEKERAEAKMLAQYRSNYDIEIAGRE